MIHGPVMNRQISFAEADSRGKKRLSHYEGQGLSVSLLADLIDQRLR